MCIRDRDGSRGAFNIDIKIVVEDGQSKMYVDDTFITSIPTLSLIHI